MIVLSLALTYFLVSNPIGNVPLILSIVKDFPFERQRIIILREGILAFLVALFFQFFGEFFLSTLAITDYALSISAGLILFILALRMIFHSPEAEVKEKLKQEPFLVPIATPMISGAGLMSIIMITSRQVNNNLIVTASIALAWVGAMIVFATAPYLQKMIGKRGLDAMEQVMGMILALMSMDMLVRGSIKFFKLLQEV